MYIRNVYFKGTYVDEGKIMKLWAVNYKSTDSVYYPVDPVNRLDAHNVTCSILQPTIKVVPNKIKISKEMTNIRDCSICLQLCYDCGVVEPLRFI